MQPTVDLRTTYTQQAKAILGGLEKSPGEILTLAIDLADLSEFELARRILEKAYEKSNRSADPALYLTIIQKRALYTYKDSGLRKDERLDEAREILNKDEVMSQTTDQETLGLAAAIYRRRWEVDSQKQNLELALRYYSKGFRQGPETDQGYTGINAAFLLDVLADMDDKEAREAGEASETAVEKRKQAEQIRKEIIAKVEPLEVSLDPAKKKDWWWFYATISEAYFGLREYDKAIIWLVDKPAENGLTVVDWQRESTSRQLGALARLQTGSAIREAEFAKTEPGAALTKLLKSADAVGSAFAGKIGLGLSGGGFRASLFHIGVLARLAELDLLRRIEVFSCVSGGSIIGAHYYLALRDLLQKNTDQDIKQEHYIQLIKDIEKEFVKGIQSNIRTRVLAEFSTNLKRVFLPSYSRTKRVGDLYERDIFSRVEKDEAKRKNLRRQKLYLNRLGIRPCIGPNQQDEAFDPNSHNWSRRNKVPVLVLNAATLNTGHSWHFTTSYMGEPPPLRNSKIENNYRLRRVKYTDAPEKYKEMRLGRAVAASSCVPGLFEPLVLNGLYPHKSVLLVDGGVCDNQGIQGLVQNDCNVILVSDGSGQMGTLDVPSNGVLGVPLRSVGISQARVRESQHDDLRARKRSSLVREFLFLHLKQDLNAGEINSEGSLAQSKSRLMQEKDRTGYGVATDVQTLLAGIRTDLDSFCEAEAYALMASAYSMTTLAVKESEFLMSLAGTEKLTPWTFREIEKSMQPEGTKKEKLKGLLKASASRSFKVWKISKPLKYTGIILLVAAIVACFYWPGAQLIPAWSVGRLNAKLLGWIVVGIIGLSVLMYLIGKLHEPTKILLKRWGQSVLYILIGVVMLFGGFLIARLHLYTFDRWYLKVGKLEQFKE